jgi:hypothetical protein
MNFPNLISVKALEKYKLHLEYDDGTSGIVDLSNFAGQGVFKYWEENNNFFKVYIDEEGGGIAWSKGLDICPDAQYLKIKNLSFEEWKLANSSYAASI